MEPRWRSAVPSDFGSLDLLCAEGFGLPAGHSFFDDFPVWDVRRPMGRRWIEVAEDPASSRILAQLGAVQRASLTEPAPLTIVGAVVTRASEQGRGLARAGLAHLIRKTESHGARSWLLWTGDDRLYRPMGFEPFGRQWRTSIRAVTGPLGSGERVERGWSDDIANFLTARTRGLRMTEHESKPFRKLASVDWWSLRAEGGQLLAVGAIGKGVDLGGILHDWHGSESALRALLSAISKELPETALLYGPALLDAHPWLKKLEPEFEDPLCYWKGEPPSRPEELWFWGCDSC